MNSKVYVRGGFCWQSFAEDMLACELVCGDLSISSLRLLKELDAEGMIFEAEGTMDGRETSAWGECFSFHA